MYPDRVHPRTAIFSNSDANVLTGSDLPPQPGDSLRGSENGRPMNLSLMPTEIILMIASVLPPSTRTLLALGCKRFISTLRIPAKLKMPPEQPSNFQEPSMSEPRLYHPERWEFLRLLEKDLFDSWLLCFDCFRLHPAQRFVKPEPSLVPWLKSCGGLFGSHIQPRSCRRLEEAGSYSLSGVVDVCPCLKMTPGKKRGIQAKLHALEQKQDHHCWWHICRHVYNDITLEIKLRFFSYTEGDGLGVIVEYHRTRPSDSSSVSPRMMCPHIHLDCLIETFSQCRDLHSEHIVCARCKGLQHCKDCKSTVYKFTKKSNPTSAVDSCSVSVARKLDEKLRSEHTVFQFARQRQQNSIRRRSSWKLW